MRKFSPEANAFFEHSLKKQEAAKPPKSEKAETETDFPPVPDIDMEEPEAREAIEDIAEAVQTEAKQAGETIPELADDLSADKKKRASLLQKLSKSRKKVVAALGLGFILGVLAGGPTAEAGSDYRQKGHQQRESKTVYPLQELFRLASPELSRVRRAAKEIMLGSPVRNSDGSIRQERGDIVRNRDGVNYELGRHMRGRWSREKTYGPPIDQFEISDSVELFKDWSIQERSVQLPNGKTFDYYGPWPDSECPPAVFLMYTSGKLDSFTKGKFPGPTIRAWRPGQTIPPSRMTDRFYRVRELNSMFSKGYTSSQRSQINIETPSFWLMWEMYRQDPNQRRAMEQSGVARSIEKYHDVTWEGSWEELVQAERAEEQARKDRKKMAARKAKEKRKAARQARRTQRQNDKRKARNRTGVH